MPLPSAHGPFFLKSYFDKVFAYCCGRYLKHAIIDSHAPLEKYELEHRELGASFNRSPSILRRGTLFRIQDISGSLGSARSPCIEFLNIRDGVRMLYPRSRTLPSPLAIAVGLAVDIAMLPELDPFSRY